MEKRDVGFFAAGLLTAEALFALYRRLKSRRDRFTGADDPIVVAGGSLEIGSRFGFSRVNDNQVVHKSPAWSVIGIEVLYHDQANGGGPKYAYMMVAPVSGKGNISVALTYKEKNSATTDTITILSDPTLNNLTKLTIQNTLNGSGIGTDSHGNAIANGTKTLRHPKSGWVLTQIAVAANPSSVITLVSGVAGPYACDNNKCQLVVHYSLLT